MNNIIQTPSGLRKFSGIRKIKHNEYFHLKFSNGEELKCSIKHPLKTDKGIIMACDLTSDIPVHSKTGLSYITYKELIKTPIWMYDLLDVENENIYYTNGVVSHNCTFQGSAEGTLLSNGFLRTLGYIDPIKLDKSDKLCVYHHPEKDHFYMMTVDTARGLKNDYSAFIITDITNDVGIVCATFRDDTILVNDYIKIILEYAIKYNHAYIMPELNDSGGQVADTLCNDENDYPNMIRVQRDKKSKSHNYDYKIVEYGGRPGMQTTGGIKRIGCMHIKSMLENRKLIPNDYNLICEMSNFIIKKENYEASAGNSDDLIMCLVMLGWIMSRSDFIAIYNKHKEETKSNTDGDNKSNKVTKIDRMVTVLFDSHNQEQNTFDLIEDGCVWKLSTDESIERILNNNMPDLSQYKIRW